MIGFEVEFEADVVFDVFPMGPTFEVIEFEVLFNGELLF